MAKNSIADWDTDPANNTDVGGANISEGCPPSGINNAIREMMAQIKTDAITRESDDLKWLSKAIGELYAVDDSMTGADTPPSDNAAYRYIKLTASDAYNTGVLTSESVTGSAPLVVATAVIDDEDSPLDGETVNLINTERRFLRAGSAGTVQNDQMQQIVGDVTQGGAGVFFGRNAPTATGVFDVVAGTSSITSTGSAFVSYDIYFDSADSPGARAGTETRSKNIGVTYYMRIR